MKPTSTSQRPVSHVRTVTTLGGAVLLDLKRGRYHSLNETGVMIWEALEQGNDVDAIVAALCEAFDVAPEYARNDVSEFVAKLAKERVVHGN